MELLEAPIKKRYQPNGDGYVRLRLADGRTVEEHRWVIVQALGRELAPHEIVRHLNGDRADNSISNLMLDERGDERKAKLVGLVCASCSNTFTREAKLVALSRQRGQTHFYCSRKCVGKSCGRKKGS